MSRKHFTWLILQIILIIAILIALAWAIRESKEEEIDLPYYNHSEIFVGGVKPIIILEQKVVASITKYNPTVEQCDDTPEIMASGNRVYLGAIACPREYPFGTIVEIDGIQYVCEDRTHERYDGRFDILTFNREEALEWGKQIKEVTIYL